MVEASRPSAAPYGRSKGHRKTMNKPVRQLDRVVIRFAGDSGDGMQLTGDRFTSDSAVAGPTDHTARADAHLALNLPGAQVRHPGWP